VPPIFSEIQNVSGTSTKEMHQVFNMGHRMEVYCKPRYTDRLLATIEPYGIAAQVIGRTEPSKVPGNHNHITVTNLSESLDYSQES